MLSAAEIYEQGYRNGYTAARFSDWPASEGGAAYAQGMLDPVSAYADLVEYGGQAEQQARDYAPGEFLGRELSVWRDPDKAWKHYNAGVADGLRIGAMNRLELDAGSRQAGGPTNIPVSEFRAIEKEVAGRRTKMARAGNGRRRNSKMKDLDFRTLKVGQKLQFSTKSGDATFSGTITEISPYPDGDSAFVDLDADQPGMYIHRLYFRPRSGWTMQFGGDYEMDVVFGKPKKRKRKAARGPVPSRADWHEGSLANPRDNRDRLDPEIWARISKEAQARADARYGKGYNWWPNRGYRTWALQEYTRRGGRYRSPRPAGQVVGRIGPQGRRFLHEGEVALPREDRRKGDRRQTDRRQPNPAALKRRLMK